MSNPLQKNYPNVFTSQHPLVKHKLTLLRDIETPYYLFRRLCYEISLLLFYEATQKLVTQRERIQTPLETNNFEKLVHTNPTIVPILRAGISMLDAFLTLIPNAKIGHIGLARDEHTFAAKGYYCKIPENLAESPIFICDPMLATGGSAKAAIEILKTKGATQINLVSIIGAPAGIEHVLASHPNVTIYLGHVDRELNQNAYIVPGLGDAGDRYCGTFD